MSEKEESQGSTSNISSCGWNTTKGLLDMPFEVLNAVFAMVTHKDLLNLRLTCHHLREAASHPSIFKLELKSWPYSIEDVWQLKLNREQLMHNVTSLHLDRQEVKDFRRIHLDLQHVTVEILVQLQQTCTRLQSLELEHYEIKKEVSFGNFPRTLTSLRFTDSSFEDPSMFFNLKSCAHFEHQLLTLEIVRSEVGSCIVFDGIGAFTNLRSLHLENVDSLNDEHFVQLGGRLPKLNTLELNKLKIGYESFLIVGCSFQNLKSLTVKNCPLLRDDGFSELKDLQLERLVIEGCEISDDGMGTVLSSMVKLRVLELNICVLGHDTFNAICTHLPHLESLKLCCNTVHEISDESVHNFIMRVGLKTLILEGILLLDHQIRCLISKVPNLTKLHISCRNMNDACLQIIAENLPALNSLCLFTTKVTNYGLASIIPTMTALNHLEIESDYFTESGLLPIIDFLAGMAVVDIRFRNGMGRNKSQLQFHRMPQDHATNLRFSKLTSLAFSITILPAFVNVTELTFADCKLTTSDMQRVDEFHPHLNILQIIDCDTTDNLALAVFSGFTNLQSLRILHAIGANEALLKLVDRRTLHALRSLHIESETVTFPCEATIKRVAPILSSLNDFNIHSVSRRTVLMMEVGRDDKKLTFRGNMISDIVLHAIISQVRSLTTLIIMKTSISVKGFHSVTKYLNELVHIELDLSSSCDHCQLTADKAMSVLGKRVTSNLKFLSIRGDTLTDRGLHLLGHHLNTLDNLCVIRSSMTVEGIRSMASKLRTIKHVSFCGHKSLNQEFARSMNLVIGKPGARFELEDYYSDSEDFHNVDSSDD